MIRRRGTLNSPAATAKTIRIKIMPAKSYDIIIAGGGVMGSSSAYHLIKADPSLKIAVIERDPSYEKASSTLSMANVRLQFSLKENIIISQYAMEVMKTFGQDMEVEGDQPEVSFCQEGNLYFCDQDGLAVAKRDLELQQSLGCDVQWWSPEEAAQHYPLFQPQGLAGGTFGATDGHIDAYAVLMGYRNKARSLGVEFIKDEVLLISQQNSAVSGVRLASGGDLAAAVVINCAGAWAADLAQTVGVSIPVIPVNRQIFVMDTTVKPEGPLPLTLVPSGLYFRTETGGLILMGKSKPDDKVGFDFSWDRDRWMNEMWPEIAELVPAFDTAKLIRGWGGLYAVNTLDENAILGQWPELKGLYMANGFSGHGLQQAPAVGRYLSELILEKQPSLDLSIFSPERVLANRPIPGEAGII